MTILDRPPVHVGMYDKRTNTMAREWIKWFDQFTRRFGEGAHDPADDIILSLGGALAGAVARIGELETQIETGQPPIYRPAPEGQETVRFVPMTVEDFTPYRPPAQSVDHGEQCYRPWIPPADAYLPPAPYPRVDGEYPAGPDPRAAMGYTMAALAGTQIGMVRPRIRASGDFFLPATVRGSTTTMVLTLNRLYLYPVSQLMTIDALMMEVTTIGVGNARLGLYDVTSTGMPGILIEEAAEISLGATGMIAAALAADREITGPVWIGMVCSIAGTVRIASSASTGDIILGCTTFNQAAPTLGYYTAHTYGALPADLSAASLTAFTSSAPQIGVRAA